MTSYSAQETDTSLVSLSLSHIILWLDPLPRSGYENMAADELLSRRSESWLRVYSWALPSVSYGYFDTATCARSLFPGADAYIRRWTGGGIVDHRHGVTYTITLPARSDDSPYPQSALLYEWIHGALAQALRSSGVECSLLSEDAPDGGRACWASPVASDIVDPHGRKLAGAGQRRYRGAVLHQGLIQQCEPSEGWPHRLAELLADAVTVISDAQPWEGFHTEPAALCREKYLAPSWEDETHGRRKISR